MKGSSTPMMGSRCFASIANRRNIAHAGIHAMKRRKSAGAWNITIFTALTGDINLRYLLYPVNAIDKRSLGLDE